MLLRVPGAQSHHERGKNSDENGEFGLGVWVREHVQVNGQAFHEADERDYHWQADFSHHFLTSNFCESHHVVLPICLRARGAGGVAEKQLLEHEALAFHVFLHVFGPVARFLVVALIHAREVIAAHLAHLRARHGLVRSNVQIEREGGAVVHYADAFKVFRARLVHELHVFHHELVHAKRDVENGEERAFHEFLVFPLVRFVLPWRGIEARAAASLKKFLGNHELTIAKYAFLALISMPQGVACAREKCHLMKAHVGGKMDG